MVLGSETFQPHRNGANWRSEWTCTSTTFFFRLLFVEDKFECLKNGEAKQTEMSEFRAEKGLLQGPSKENRQLVLKKTEFFNGLGGRVSKGKIWGEGCRVCDFPVFGWWWRNKVVFRESCAQPEVTFLQELGGGLSSYRRTQRHIVIYLWGELSGKRILESKYRPQVTELEFNIHWNIIFFFLKLPSLLPNIAELRLICLPNKSG